MTTESTQEAPDVVIGTFLVNSSPASVLFDLGASHSLISADFVKKNTLIKHIVKKVVLVKSLGGEMKATLRCPMVKLDLRRVDF